jgi:hypothetical protein
VTQRKIDEAQIDEALANWPSTARSPLDWDEAADQVITRIQSPNVTGTERMIADDALFGAPLPQEPGEPEPRGAEKARPAALRSQEDRQRERSNLQSLVKLANTPPPPGVGKTPSAPPIINNTAGGDSGIVDLKILASLDPFGAARAKTTPLAAVDLYEDDEVVNTSDVIREEEEPSHVSPWGVGARPPSNDPPPGSLNDLVPDERSSAPPQSAPRAARPNRAALLASARAQLHDAPANSGGGLAAHRSTALAWGMAIVAVAAAVLFFVKTRQKDAPVAEVVATAEPPAASASASAAPPPAPPTAAQTAAAASSAPTTGEKVASADELPLAPKKQAQTKSGPRPTEDKPKVAVAAKPKEESSSSSSDPNDLRSEIEKRAGSKEPKQEAADSTGSQSSSSLPQRPSGGEITGAINAALPNARACLGPDDPVSYATIVFDSSGKVSSVTVSGGAEGKPAEQCIRTAMGHVKVQPFAESSFTARATVRP